MQTLQHYIKIFCFTILGGFALPVIANPTPPPGMPGKIQQMQAAVQCLKSIDQSSLRDLKQESKKLKQEAKALCKAGERDQAQNKAMTFAKGMMENPAIKRMLECRKLASGMIPKLPFENFEKNAKNKHICDEVNAK